MMIDPLGLVPYIPKSSLDIVNKLLIPTLVVKLVRAIDLMIVELIILLVAMM